MTDLEWDQLLAKAAEVTELADGAGEDRWAGVPLLRKGKRCAACRCLWAEAGRFGGARLRGGQAD